MASNPRFINPDSISKPPGYTHVVETTAPGRTVYIAGQLGLDVKGNVVGDFRAQAAQAFVNLQAALAAVGANTTNLVKINCYIVDIATNIPIFRDVRDQHLNMTNPPASTAIGIPALARDGALFEIEAVAFLPG